MCLCAPCTRRPLASASPVLPSRVVFIFQIIFSIHVHRVYRGLRDLHRVQQVGSSLRAGAQGKRQLVLQTVSHPFRCTFQKSSLFHDQDPIIHNVVQGDCTLEDKLDRRERKRPRTSTRSDLVPRLAWSNDSQARTPALSELDTCI